MIISANTSHCKNHCCSTDIGDKGLELAVSRGAILHSEEFDFIDHGKLFIVLGENEERLFGFFFINSKIVNYIARNEQFYNMQMGIKRSDYPDILDYDSFVGCHELMSIIVQLKSGDVKIRGCLNKNDIDLMLDTVRRSELFTQTEKETFFK